MTPTLSIITVIYEQYEVLRDFFASLNNQTDKQFHLYLADLSDKPRQIHTTLPHTIIRSHNGGYAHGVNMGIQEALRDGHTYYAVINNDTVISKSFVEKTIQSLRNHPHSLVGGTIYYAPGYEYHNHYTPQERGKVIWYGGGFIDWNHATTHHLHVDEVDATIDKRPTITQFITGCFIAYDQSVAEDVGAWDESYFMYYEDADYGERAKRKGINLWYDPTITLWHKNAQSTGGSGSSKHQQWQRVSQLRFGLKHAPWKTRIHLIKNYIAHKMGI